ncbi:MAG: hypothetical protein KBC73_24515 [Burkholderiaceae bacterium]|nr:hypothetical protein [Burkholderiaceae bacterium]
MMQRTGMGLAGMTGLRRLLWAGLAWAALAAPAQASNAGDDGDGLRQQAQAAAWAGDIDRLEQLYRDALRQEQPNDWDGEPAAASVRAGILQMLRANGANAMFYRELDLLTGRWARERPTSALAQWVHVRAIFGRAWHVRGDTYANKVPGEAMAEYGRLIARAEAHLRQHGELLRNDSTARLYTIMVGRSAGWSPQQLRAVADDWLSRSRLDEASIYEELVVSLSPRWLGNWELVAEVIEQAGRRTPQDAGDRLYARLWSTMAGWIDGNLFEQVPAADWKRVRRGMLSLSSGLRDPSFANRTAYLACLARDRQTLQEQLARIGEQLDLSAWVGGGAGGSTNLEACRLWLARSQPG